MYDKCSDCEYVDVENIRVENRFLREENEKLKIQNQKYKEVIDKLNVKLNQYKNDLKAYQKQDTINHRAISIGLIGVKIRAFEDILKEVE